MLALDEFTWAGIGAVMAGIGSLLSGIAAYKTAKLAKEIKGEPETRSPDS